jgi:uncharacterized protein YdeI (YjbR/CyaY-like superfamily)
VSEHGGTMFFETAEDFAGWLEAHGREADEVFIGLAKKNSAKTSPTLEEAIDVALCFGWIDSLGRRLDDDWFRLRFTPRRPRSNWSARNRRRAEELISAGLMREPGLAEVERAKADGRWDAAAQ